MGYANGYVRIYMPNHPHANISGMVYEHVLVAEKKLGRYLTAEEVVHHIDHNRSNNNPDNLMIFKTKKDHSIFHMNEEDFTLFRVMLLVFWGAGAGGKSPFQEC